MAISTIVYRIQLFAFSLITSLLIFQYELIMTDRKVLISTSLMIYSISQIMIMLATLFWGRAIEHVKSTSRLIQVSLCIRIIVTGMMFLVTQNTVFIVLFLLYHTVSSSIDVIFEGLLVQWAFTRKIPFGKFRLFGSIGYASSGLIASFIFAMTGQVHYLLMFVFIINVLILVGTFLFPLNVSMSHTKGKKSPIAKKYLFLIFLCAFIITLPNSFGVVLNNHYRTVLHLSVEQAIFFAGIALVVGSLISEATGFYFADNLITKFSAKGIIFIGMILCCVRWIMAILSPNSILFTMTYLFHGISFALIYLGCINYMKEKIGEDSSSKIVINFSFIAAIIGFILTQLFSIILKHHTTEFLLGGYIVISLLVGALYYFYYWRD